MPNYVGYSPWTDAAQYGSGLGQALTQGLLQNPQQRAMMLGQLAQMQSQQQQQAQRLQLETALRDVQGKEALARMAAAQAEIDHWKNGGNLKKPSWKPNLDKQGNFLGSFNTETGDYKPYNAPAGHTPVPPPVTGGNAPVSGPGSPTMNNVRGVSDLFGRYLQGLQLGANTNSPAAFNGVSNLLMQALSRQPVSNAAPQLGAMTNGPVQGPLPPLPPPVTNGAPITVGGFQITPMSQ